MFMFTKRPVVAPPKGKKPSPRIKRAQAMAKGMREAMKNGSRGNS